MARVLSVERALCASEPREGRRNPRDRDRRRGRGALVPLAVSVMRTGCRGHELHASPEAGRMETPEILVYAGREDLRESIRIEAVARGDLSRIRDDAAQEPHARPT